MSKVYIVSIEPIETRYTKHWHTFLPKQIEDNTGFDVVQIDGQELSNQTSTGAFLNFTSTVNYKATQVQEIARLFHEGQIKSGDIFLVTDAWNPGSHFIRYMSDLSDIDIKIVGIWHAGSYDKWDFLGRKFKDKSWSYSLERSLYNLYDLNVFATYYHMDLFESIIEVTGKYLRCGFPMEYYPLDIKYTEWEDKEDIVLFPHRISEEKNPSIFREISKSFPEYQFIFAQEVCKSKDDYHRLLERSKVVFSANKQETLGISIYEGMLAGCLPLVPDRLSYTEMYDGLFTYEPGEIFARLDFLLKSGCLEPALKNNISYLKDNYFSGTSLYQALKDL